MTQIHEPDVRRYWWLKRAIATGAILFALLILAWLLWSWHASRQMSQLLSELRAARHPLTIESLYGQPIPEDQNGAASLIRAYNQLSAVDVPSNSNMDRTDDLPYPPAWHAMMDKAYPANAALYPLIGQARAMPALHWPDGSTTIRARATALAPGLAGARQLANVLGDTALHHHFNANEQEAIATILDLQYLAKATATRGMTASALVATGIEIVAMDRVCTMAPGFRIPAGDEGKALSDTTRWMITDLSGEGPFRNWFRNAIDGEIALLIEDDIAQTRPLILGPLKRLERIAMIRGFLARKESLKLSNIADAQARRATRPNLETSATIGRVLDSARMLRTIRMAEMSRRRAAIALAIALYRNHHQRYPATLAELVPTYLPAIPADPSAADGKPFAYLIAANGTRPVLIAAGEDGVVQTTDQSFLPSSAHYGWHDIRRNKSDDQYLDLSPWKNPTPPAQ